MNWLAPEQAEALEAAGTTAYRIASGQGEWIERFGGSVLISVTRRENAEPVAAEVEGWHRRAGRSVSRLFVRYLVRQPREADRPTLLRGDADAPRREIVRENGLCYEVDFDAGYSVGLFCDQRANRRFLQGLAPGRVLNTFAYTCAFAVAAAARGATTVNVDLSKSSLARGRRNFQLNGFDPASHRFLIDDVMDVLPRLARRGETFDAIVLDPPTFGRSSPQRAFRAERDYEELIAMAVDCASPGAWILLSTNCSRLTTARLRAMASRVARGKVIFHDEPPEPDFPAGHGAATVWMQWGVRGARTPSGLRTVR